MSNAPLAFAEAGFPIIPVRLHRERDRWKKLPLREWDLATTNEITIRLWWSDYPDALPAIPLKRTNLCVVDADRRDGVDGVAEVTDLGPLGPHSRIATPSGGLHLVFAQPDPPITSKFTWCAGVEVLGSASLLTCYDLEELKFPHVAPRAVLPRMFWQPREARATNTNLIKKMSAPRSSDAVLVADLTEALRKMDPCDCRGEHDEWFKLMVACCYYGIACEDFVRWSTSDPHYARDGDSIRRRWHRLEPAHGGALMAALSARGIKVQRRSRTAESSPSVFYEVPDSRPITSQRTRTSNRSVHFQHATIKPRIDGLLRRLQRMATEQELFNSACFMAELTPMPQRDATGLLEQAVKDTALWRALGRDGVRKTIERGFVHIERKAGLPPEVKLTEE